MQGSSGVRSPDFAVGTCFVMDRLSDFSGPQCSDLKSGGLAVPDLFALWGESSEVIVVSGYAQPRAFTLY